MPNPNNDIMANDGVKKLILTQNNVFTNSTCIVVEYYDVLKAPWFAFIQLLKDSDTLKEFFDTSDYVGKESYEAFNRYTLRRYRNPLLDLPMNIPAIAAKLNIEAKPNTPFTKEELLKIHEWANHLLQDSLRINPIYFSDDYCLNFLTAFERLLEMKKLVKKYIVYDEYSNPNVEQDIQENYHGAVTYVSGPFEELLKVVPTDTTYVFSDVRKIGYLKEYNRLEFSSILLAESFGYNYTKNYDDYLVDVFEYLDDIVFKFNIFNNIN